MIERVHVMRQTIVKLTQMLAGRGIEVTQQGISAYVRADATGRPILVNLPYMPDNATEELIQAIQGFLDHEVAHILFTDFPVMTEATAAGAGSMLNIIEDARIEKAMAERFQGSAFNLGNTGKFFLDKYTEPKVQQALAGGDQAAVVGVLMVPLLRAMSGQQVFKEYMKDKMPLIDEAYQKIKHLEGAIAAATSTRECLELAKKVVKALRDGDPGAAGGAGGGGTPSKGKGSPGGGPAAPGAGDEEDDGSGKGKSKAAGSKKKAAAPTPTPAPAPDPEEKDEEDDAKSKGGKGAAADENEEDSDAESEEERDEDDGEAVDPESTAADEAEPEELDTEEAPEEEDEGMLPPTASGAGGGGSEEREIDSAGMDPLTWNAIDKETKNDYDASLSNMISTAALATAKDAEYIVFTTDKDVVEPLHVGKQYSPSMLVDLQSKVEHMVGPLQKDLERAISARSLVMRSAGHRSGRIHAANLVRLNFNDDRVFTRKQESTSKDVAVSLVVDASGSMGGSKIHTAAQSAYALTSVLERIGIKCEAICFTTGEAVTDWTTIGEETKKMGRAFSRSESLYMPILKSFEERMTTEVKSRFGWLPNSSILASNIDGECVDIAARRLLSRRETGKVMLVLSDGNPAGAGGARGLQEHLAKTVKKITKQGINVIGIGIEDAAVQRYYPKNVVIKSSADLPAMVMKELRSLIVK